MCTFLVYGNNVVELAELANHLGMYVFVAVSDDRHFGNLGVCRFVNLKRAYVEASASEKLGNANENAEAVHNGEVELYFSHVVCLL